jgi:hypothetical protein
MMSLGCSHLKKGTDSLTGEIKGTNQPEETTKEVVPESKTFQVSYDQAWKSALQVFKQKHAGLLKENKKSGEIVTRERKIQNESWFDAMVMIAPEYSVKEYVEISAAGKGVEIKYRAEFTKTLSRMMSSQHEYPEAENAIRKKFFDDLNKIIGG